MRKVKGLIKLVITAIVSIPFLILCETSWSFNIEQIEREINSKDWQVRLAGVEKLRGMNDKKSLDLLLEVAGARGEYWPVKIKAMELLGERGDPAAIPVLLDIYNDIFLHSECPSIKSYAGKALGNFKGNEKVVDALISGIDDPELLIRESSIDSLGKIGNPKAVEPLLKLLNDKSFAIRYASLKALANIGDKKAIPYIKNVAEKDSDPVIKEFALLILNKLN